MVVTLQRVSGWGLGRNVRDAVGVLGVVV